MVAFFGLRWTYDWYSCRIGGDFPVIDCTEAGLVSEPLTWLRDGNRARLRGRFGVFQPGRLILEKYNRKGSIVATEILDPSASPLKPVVIDREVDCPSSAHSIAVILHDTEGSKLGILCSDRTQRKETNRRNRGQCSHAILGGYRYGRRARARVVGYPGVQYVGAGPSPVSVWLISECTVTKFKTKEESFRKMFWYLSL